MNTNSKVLIEFESRACDLCLHRKTACDFNVRPCEACASRGLEMECLKDACVMRRSCGNCRKAKRTCDKKRPCERCIRVGKQDSCQSYCNTGKCYVDKAVFEKLDLACKSLQECVIPPKATKFLGDHHQKRKKKSLASKDEGEPVVELPIEGLKTIPPSFVQDSVMVWNVQELYEALGKSMDDVSPLTIQEYFLKENNIEALYEVLGCFLGEKLSKSFLERMIQVNMLPTDDQMSPAMEKMTEVLAQQNKISQTPKCMEVIQKQLLVLGMSAEVQCEKNFMDSLTGWGCFTFSSSEGRSAFSMNLHAQSILGFDPVELSKILSHKMVRTMLTCSEFDSSLPECIQFVPPFYWLLHEKDVLSLIEMMLKSIVASDNVEEEESKKDVAPGLVPCGTYVVPVINVMVDAHGNSYTSQTLQVVAPGQLIMLPYQNQYQVLHGSSFNAANSGPFKFSSPVPVQLGENSFSSPSSPQSPSSSQRETTIRMRTKQGKFIPCCSKVKFTTSDDDKIKAFSFMFKPTIAF